MEHYTYKPKRFSSRIYPRHSLNKMIMLYHIRIYISLREDTDER